MKISVLRVSYDMMRSKILSMLISRVLERHQEVVQRHLSVCLTILESFLHDRKIRSICDLRQGTFRSIVLSDHVLVVRDMATKK